MPFSQRFLQVAQLLRRRRRRGAERAEFLVRRREVGLEGRDLVLEGLLHERLDVTCRVLDGHRQGLTRAAGTLLLAGPPGVLPVG